MARVAGERLGRFRHGGIVSMVYLGGGGVVKHPLAINVFRPRWWPPFFSSTVFRPKILVVVKNAGEDLSAWRVALDLARHDGPLSIGTAPSIVWTTAITQLESDRPWRGGETKRRWLKLASTSLPTAGTYVMRITYEGYEPSPDHEGALVGQEIACHLVSEYFRIEPMASVLTFGLIVATLMTAVATLAVALVS